MQKKNALLKYKRHCTELFRSQMMNSAPGEYDDVALPSYTHRIRAMRWLFWRRLDKVHTMMESRKYLRVVDFGCGGGASFGYLHALEAQITGCDICSLETAKKLAGALSIPVEFCAELRELLDNSQDMILALDVLEHIENLEETVEEFRRVGTSDSQLLLSGPTENILYRFGRYLAGFSGHYHLTKIYYI